MACEEALRACAMRKSNVIHLPFNWFPKGIVWCEKRQGPSVLLRQRRVQMNLRNTFCFFLFYISFKVNMLGLLRS